jgi:hypothetical protein
MSLSLKAYGESALLELDTMLDTEVEYARVGLGGYHRRREYWFLFESPVELTRSGQNLAIYLISRFMTELMEVRLRLTR